MRRSGAWLAAHFRDPNKVTPGTKMPKLSLSKRKVEALVDYVGSLGGRSYSDQAPKLFEDNCATCHKFHAVGREIGPDLSSVGQNFSIDFIKAYIKNPLMINKGATMAGFENSLTPGQITGLANYLYQQGK
jgi:mono/diheme cytochrome c family protein